MLFIKYRIENVPGKTGPQTNWGMILRTPEDVLKYLEVDVELNTYALMSLNINRTQSHLSAPRERVLSIMCDVAACRAEEKGEKAYALDVLNELNIGKGKNMLRLISEGNSIMVNHNGGYCPWEGFKKTWDLEVIDYLEKDSTYFPTDKEAHNKKVLFLENAERLDVIFRRDVGKLYPELMDINYQHHPGHEYSVGIIETLKEIDPKFVLQSIKNAQIVAFQSEFRDQNQLDSMMNAFAAMDDKKTVVIRTSEEGKAALTGHKLYQLNSKFHEVVFI